MKLLAFSVFDLKSGAFAHPFFVPAVGLARRMFCDWTNAQNTPLAKHPEDFRLFSVGSFDDADGRFEYEAPPKLVATALDYREAVHGPVEVKNA